ncbi:putative beta-glucan synthesis-associated protein SKN1 [Kockovaella imperatae]|uniref:Putative beta-glucan synthesis-associated protein SKN1 n=1 Tax=Kockovaella imperatae TaxID=4999 RepID=A0A1Y1UQL6_9TREE|nr:putative beta-glucan synthesis-associated protein SKN1 [Kockovaella imperatae]ORX40279.1 putative beta-glucan synthesis-associated protein SKN1 [Kockovaella imperatae]
MPPSTTLIAAEAAHKPPRHPAGPSRLSHELSAARRYGPTASSAPVGPNAALLGSPAQSVSDRPPPGHDGGAPWTSGIDSNPEADDYLHNPDPKRDRKNDRAGTVFTSRGVVNIGCLSLLLVGIVTFNNGGFNLGGINASGQVPLITNFATVIDEDTPQSAMTYQGYDGKTYDLVFSDEFNKDGRTFFDGDDPYWTAVDLHYWPTGDFEWYDPSAITTANGSLVITMTQEPIHDLNFKSGMLQSWNKMCFSGSVYIEVRLSLPGTPAVGGFWPGVWMMGNLGRPGYGATTDGMWPYTYDSCDIGTLKNQTEPDGEGPALALTSGNTGGIISYLPGQRTSACTCAGEDHPGPSTNVGRGVPEIDIIEGQTDLSYSGGRGQASQSAQVAPFDAYYQYGNSTPEIDQYDLDITKWNSYKGGVYQEAVSSLTYISRDDYQLTTGGFSIFGFEYYADSNNRNDGYITWVADGQKSWTMNAAAVGPRSNMGIGQRLISEEPMAMVINFGMSNNFQTVNFDDLTWPAHFLIDYVRVYQTSDGEIGCDPANYPTQNYINAHMNAYTDPNLTIWSQAGYGVPKNSLIDTC